MLRELEENLWKASEVAQNLTFSPINVSPLISSLILTHHLTVAERKKVGYKSFNRSYVLQRAMKSQLDFLNLILKRDNKSAAMDDISLKWNLLKHKIADILPELCFYSSKHEIFCRTHQIAEGNLHVMMQLYQQCFNLITGEGRKMSSDDDHASMCNLLVMSYYVHADIISLASTMDPE